MQTWPVSTSNATATWLPPRNPRILTLGTFDVLHAGHVRFLETAARFGELTVGVNSDRFVRSYKRPPLNDQRRRFDVIVALRCVHHVVVNDGPGVDVIRQLKPDVLAVGADWLEKDYLAQIGMRADDLLGQGTTLAFMPPPREPGLSSSALRGAA